MKTWIHQSLFIGAGFCGMKLLVGGIKNDWWILVLAVGVLLFLGGCLAKSLYDDVHDTNPLRPKTKDVFIAWLLYRIFK